MSGADEERPPMAVAMEWVARLTTFGLEMSLPPLAGWWADARLGTRPWLLIAGAVLGFVTGFTHLLRQVAQTGDSRTKRPDSGRSREGGADP